MRWYQYLYIKKLGALFRIHTGVIVYIANHIGIGGGNNKTLLSGELTKRRFDGSRHSIGSLRACQ
ncbi:hypothetical protein GCM10023116_01120 [Kistimonas scapharcae]|uniref:Uncharacterized protein n=1 Tax=Kistimonas scapharcae TaxID=1036133 RepID=A0ABP8UVK1_9GAMM